MSNIYVPITPKHFSLRDVCSQVLSKHWGKETCVIIWELYWIDAWGISLIFWGAGSHIGRSESLSALPLEHCWRGHSHGHSHEFTDSSSHKIHWRPETLHGQKRVDSLAEQLPLLWIIPKNTLVPGRELTLYFKQDFWSWLFQFSIKVLVLNW